MAGIYVTPGDQDEVSLTSGPDVGRDTLLVHVGNLCLCFDRFTLRVAEQLRDRLADGLAEVARQRATAASGKAGD